MARIRYITLYVSNFIVDKFKNILHVYVNTLIFEKKMAIIQAKSTLDIVMGETLIIMMVFHGWC